MIRILVIDDADMSEALEQLKREVEADFEESVHVEQLNPTNIITGDDLASEKEAFLSEVAQKAGELWHVVIVDINLHDTDMSEQEQLDLSLSIAEAVRSANKCASLALYSGTLSKHIPKLIDQDARSNKGDSESILRRIFLSNLAGFFGRSELTSNVYGMLDEPSWLLLIDKQLASQGGAVVSEESEFAGKRFVELAKALRAQDSLGKRVATLVADLGTASLVRIS